MVPTLALGGIDSPCLWKIVKPVFPRKPGYVSRQGRGTRGYRAITFMSVMAKCYSSVIVLMLNNTREPKGWGKRTVPGIGDEHVAETSGMVREPKEAVMHGARRYRTMYLGGVDVRTAFDVSQFGTLAEHIAALLEEMQDLKGKQASTLARRNSQTRGV